MLESGRNAPSEQTIKLICFEFGINENWLRTGEGEMKAENATGGGSGGRLSGD